MVENIRIPKGAGKATDTDFVKNANSPLPENETL